ncbi:MAG: hypothetical protein FWB93_06195 [Oscillospiraceae bacterium]|nr:hypothetical protein [Oscillospiraceae bacterium]
MKKLATLILSFALVLSLLACATGGSYDPPDGNVTDELQQQIRRLEDEVRELNNTIQDNDRLLTETIERTQVLEEEKRIIEEIAQFLRDEKNLLGEHTWGRIGMIEVAESEDGYLTFVISHCAQARITGYSLRNVEPRIIETHLREVDTTPLGIYQIEIDLYNVWGGNAHFDTPFFRQNPVEVINELFFVPEGFEGLFNVFRYHACHQSWTFVLGSDLPIRVTESEMTEVPIPNNRIEIPLGIRR